MSPLTITITQVPNGYSVQIGCQTVVLTNNNGWTTTTVTGGAH